VSGYLDPPEDLHGDGAHVRARVQLSAAMNYVVVPPLRQRARGGTDLSPPYRGGLARTAVVTVAVFTYDV
jgi:hypothetical protein